MNLEWREHVYEPLPPGVCEDCGGEGQIHPEAWTAEEGTIYAAQENWDHWALRASSAALCVACRGTGAVPPKGSA
jgi:hypothetical protein